MDVCGRPFFTTEIRSIYSSFSTDNTVAKSLYSLVEDLYTRTKMSKLSYSQFSEFYYISTVHTLATTPAVTASLWLIKSLWYTIQSNPKCDRLCEKGSYSLFN